MLKNDIKYTEIKEEYITEKNGIIYKTYPGEHLLQKIIKLMEQELSEPYPIYTYRYFAYLDNEFIGCILGDIKVSKKGIKKGYIAMIAVESPYRGMKIGSTLVKLFIEIMIKKGVDQICLETEEVNKAAQSLYESLGFMRTKKLLNYYLNGNDAFRLKYYIKDKENIL